MQRQVIETVDGVTRTAYVDCGAGRARRRGFASNGDGGGAARHLEPMPNGLRLPDFLFEHPAAMVTKAVGDRNSR